MLALMSSSSTQDREGPRQEAGEGDARFVEIHSALVAGVRDAATGNAAAAQWLSGAGAGVRVKSSPSAAPVQVQVSLQPAAVSHAAFAYILQFALGALEDAGPLAGDVIGSGDASVHPAGAVVRDQLANLVQALGKRRDAAAVFRHLHALASTHLARGMSGAGAGGGYQPPLVAAFGAKWATVQGATILACLACLRDVPGCAGGLAPLGRAFSATGRVVPLRRAMRAWAALQGTPPQTQQQGAAA